MIRNNHIRVDKIFSEELKSIKINRIKIGKDKTLKSSERLTLAITRHPLWTKIKSDILNSDLLENKRGSVMDIFTFMIYGFIAIVLIGSLVYVSNIFTTSLYTITDTSNLNISSAVADTFGQVNSALPLYRLVALSIVFGLMIGIFVSSYLVRANPVFLIVYVIVSIVAVLVSVPISNALESLRNNSILSNELSNYTAINYIYNNLPIVVTLISVIGFILLFSLSNKDNQLGGGI